MRRVLGRSQPPITVAIADRNRRLAEIMGQLLADDSRFEVVAVVATAEAAERVARMRQPDVVLVSQHLDEEPGLATCARLREAAPGTALLLWSHEPHLTAAQAPDVDAVLARGMTFQELARALRDVTRRPVVQRPRVVDLTDVTPSVVV